MTVLGTLGFAGLPNLGDGRPTFDTDSLAVLLLHIGDTHGAYGGFVSLVW